MRFANRVMLQGYLEVERMEQVVLDEKSGLLAPVIRGWLWTDTAGLERHRVVLADKPAVGLLELLRRFNPTEGGSALVRLNGQVFEVTHLDGKPFVAVEGRLVAGVVNVKARDGAVDAGSGTAAAADGSPFAGDCVPVGGGERGGSSAHVSAGAGDTGSGGREPLGLTALGHGAPDGAVGGLTSTPPRTGARAPRPQGAGR